MSDLVSSDFNLQSISTEELSEHLAATIAMEGNLMVVGRRGSGKTEIANQQIAKANCKEVYFNLSVFERPDIGGYPDVMNHGKSRFISVLLPALYQSMIEGNENVVAVLDEVDKAEKDLLAPLLELTQFHTINGIKLPNLRSCILTGNLICEGGQRPSAPLLDRCEKYLLQPNAVDWLRWGGKNKIHPSVLAFIAANNTELFGDSDPQERYADASPRGWHGVSTMLHKAEEFNWSAKLIGEKVSGRVGKQAGLNYYSYYEHYQYLLPLIDQVFSGKNIDDQYDHLEPTKKIVTTMMVCSRFSLELDKSKGKDYNLITNIGRFMDHISPDDAYMAVKTQIEIVRIFKYGLTEHPDWTRVFDKYRDILPTA